MKHRATGLAAAILLIAGVTACNRTPDVDQVPVGSDVQITRDDGTLVEGKLAARDEQAVTLDVGTKTRAIPRDKIEDVRVKAAGATPELPPAARFREIAVPATANLSIRLETPVSSESSHVEDTVHGVLTQAVSVGGTEVIVAGSAVRGHVTDVAQAGKVKGRASIAVRFDTLVAGEDTYPIDAAFSRTAASTKESDAGKIAIPAAGGAVIGGIIGGGKGAAIGAAVGGGAGTAVVLTTPGKPIDIPAGTVFTLDIGREIDVKVPIK